MGRLNLAFLLLTAVGLYAAAAGPPASVPKILGIFENLRATEGHAAGAGRPVSFALAEGEINEYVRYALQAAPRPGLDSVAVKIFPHNYISTFTVVDFDAVERWKPGTVPGILRPVLYGKRSIWIDYRFAAADAKVTFSIEKAFYEKVRLPSFAVEKVMQVIASRQPEHYDTTKPLPLPFGLRQIWTEDRLLRGNN